jgi:hypothetical protein
MARIATRYPREREIGDTFLSGRWTLWFDTDAIVDGSMNALFAAEVTLGSLHRNVSEQELDLLQLSSRRVAELCARAPQVMRGETSKGGFRGIQLDHMPDHAFRDAITPAFGSSADATEYFPRMEVSCHGSTRPMSP